MTQAERTFSIRGFWSIVVLQKQITDRFLRAPDMNSRRQLVLPTSRPQRRRSFFGRHQESRPLGWSPVFTDFLSNLTNLIDWKYERNTLHKLRKSSPARARHFWCCQKGARPLVTRVLFHVFLPQKMVKRNRSFWCISELNRQFALANC